MIEIKKTILFTGLEGTIVKSERKKRYPDCEMNVRFKDNILQALYNFADKHKTRYLFIVTNRINLEGSGMDADLFTMKKDYVCDCLCRSLESLISDIHVQVLCLYCNYDMRNTDWCKPKTRMLSHILSHKFKVIPPKETMLMIGCNNSDAGEFSEFDEQTAQNFGIDYTDVEVFTSKYTSTTF
jgi:hypothetical protein